MNFINRLREVLEGDIFTMEELKGIFCPHLNEDALRSKVARAGELVRLRRGLYTFPKYLRKKSLSNFSVANVLYAPSYVSFESALSHHGLIPEAVHTTTSACFQRKNKIFSNELGEFSFDHVPCRPFFMEVHKSRERTGELVAGALKALFDLIYIRRKKYATIEEIEEDWRIDREILKEEVCKVNIGEFSKLAESYKKNNVNNFYKILIEKFK